MTELKPCPFCGGEVEIRYIEIFAHYKRYYARCKECGSYHFWKAEEQITEAWNRRAEVKSKNNIDD